MKHILILILFLLTWSSYTVAADFSGLPSINKRAKVKLISPDALDLLVIELKNLESSPGADKSNDSLILDSYKSIAAGYVSNFHFKQAQQVYRRYLTYKEKVMVEGRKEVINNVVATESEKLIISESEHKNLLFQYTQLQSEIKELQARSFSWKSNTSLALIVASVFFAIMLVSAGISLFSLRSRLRQNREKIKSIHHASVIGKLEPELGNSILKNIVSIQHKGKKLYSETALLKAASALTDDKKAVLEKINKIINQL